MQFGQVKRREFITLIGGAAAGWPLVARGQQPAIPVIGLLDSDPLRDSDVIRLPFFRQGLSEAGYVEGRNVTIEYRSAESQNDRLPALAADLVRRQVTVIAAIGGLPPAVAAKAATATIPIVFYSAADPIGLGLIASLNRPGGNLTGVVTLGTELGPKRLELLHEVVPAATILALLVNPANPSTAAQSRDLQAAASTLGLKIHVLHASSERDFEAAFANLVKLQAGALVIGPDALFNNRSEQLAALTGRYAIPAIYQYRTFAAAGGLMSYGSDIAEGYRQVGIYTGRVLKGEKPADLPVQQSVKVELILNMKTAKALGLIIPLPILGRANEVIE